MTLSRMCVITRERNNRNEMVKITRINESWIVDKNQDMFVRSFYFTLTLENIQKIEKQKKRFKISDDNFVDIKKALMELYEKNL